MKLTVLIDYNIDTVTIVSNQLKIVFDNVKNLKTVESILEEVFNMMPDIEDNQPSYSIELSKIDEDSRTIIGEW